MSAGVLARSLWTGETPVLHVFSYFFSFTSEASMTGAGPEMPPSFLTRQK
jgi:hypothetical protein